MPATATERQRQFLHLALALIGAAVLRFSALGRQPLWLDEATTASFAGRDLWGCLLAETQHPPLYNLLVHFVVRSFGATEITLRLLPAIFGVLTVWATWRLARRLFPESAAAATLLAAASPFLIFFSQEGRSYALLILLALLATSAFFRCLDAMHESRLPGRWLALYALLSVLLLYTHYFGAFVLLAHEAVFWQKRKIWATHRVAPTGNHGAEFPGARGWLAARAAVLLAFLPWAAWVATHFDAQPREWIGPPLARVPLALVRYFFGYGIAAVDYDRLHQPILMALREEAPALLLPLLLFFWLLVRGFRRAASETRALLWALLAGPFVVLLTLAPWMNLVHERYLSFQAPFVLMLAAAGWQSLTRRPRVIVAAACAAVIVFSLAAYYAAPGELVGYRLRYGKEDWRSAAAYVEGVKPDAIVFAPGYVRPAFERYAHGLRRVSRYEVPEGTGALPDSAELRRARRVVLILSHSGAAEERLRTALAATRRRVEEKLWPQQAGIRAFVYDLQ